MISLAHPLFLRRWWLKAPSWTMTEYCDSSLPVLTLTGWSLGMTMLWVNSWTMLLP